MLDGFYVLIDGIPFAHPLLVILAALAGAQIPNVVRLSGNLWRLRPH